MPRLVSSAPFKLEAPTQKQVAITIKTKICVFNIINVSSVKIGVKNKMYANPTFAYDWEKSLAH